PGAGTDNITGMEAKISILLGLGVQTSDQVSSYKAHSLISHYKDYGLHLLNEEVKDHEKELWDEAAKVNESWTEEFIEENFDFIDMDDADNLFYTAETRKQFLNETLPFKSGVILTDFLKDGITISNY